MTEADKYAELIKNVSPLPWNTRNSIWLATTGVCGPRGWDDSDLLLDSSEDAEFIVWCGNNRGLIGQLLREAGL